MYRDAAVASIVLIIAACSSGSGSGAPVAGAPAPAPLHKITSLPDNPCELLSAEEVAAATGLRIESARRMPDIGEVLKSEREGRAARVSGICTYDASGEDSEISLIVPSVSDQSRAAFMRERGAYSDQSRVEPVSGLGEDAWLAGTTLHVLAGNTAQFMVAARGRQEHSRDLVVAVAKAVLAKIQR